MPIPTLQTQLYFNVRDFGAIGDGLSNDTTAIQNAINAVASQNGGTVFLPTGLYLITAPLAITTNNVVLKGAGFGASVIVMSTAFVGNAGVTITGANNCGVNDLSIQGQSTTYTNNAASDGIRINNSNYALLTNIFFQFINSWAIQVISNATADSLYPILTRVHAKTCKQGFHLQGTASSDGIMNAALSEIIVESIQAGDGLMLEDVVGVTCDDLQGNTIATGNALHIKGLATNIYLANLNLGALVSAAASPTAVGLIETGTNGSPSLVSIENGMFFGGLIGLSVTAGTLILVSSCQFIKNGTHGCSFTGACQVTLNGSTFNLNGFTAGAGHYDIVATSSGNILVSGCYFLTPNGTASGQTAQAMNVSTGVQNVVGNWFVGNTGANAFNGTTFIARANPGYNPQAVATFAPSVPASTTAQQNTSGVDQYVYILAGTITVIGIGATSTTTATGLTSNASGVTVFVPAGWFIKMTYSVAPTWVWMGN